MIKNTIFRIKMFFSKEAKHIKEELDEADRDLIRVVDDVVDTLIKLNVVKEADLPPDAVKKLNERRELRKKLLDSCNK
jgi:hypothetical protein